MTRVVPSSEIAPEGGLVDEIVRYLDAVEVFRRMGYAPQWLPERHAPAGALPRRGRARARARS